MTEFKVGDRVERIVAPNGQNGMTISPGCTGRITNVEIGSMFADVLWDGKTRFQCNGAEFLKKIPEEAGAPEPEFKQLKEITGHAISKYITDCTGMRNEFQRYINTYKYYGDQKANFENFIAFAKPRKGWLAFLIKHGFIERVKPEVFYKTGDRFYTCGREFMLYVDRHTIVALTSLHDGFRYGRSLKCKNTQRITMQEFSTIVSPESPERFVHSSKYAAPRSAGMGGNDSGCADVVGNGGAS